MLLRQTMRKVLLLLLIAPTSVPWPAFGQQIIEGGMRFSRKNLDILRMSSGSTSGLTASGSAAVAGGTINVGAASSEVVAELNPIFNETKRSDGQGIRADVFIAGDERQWSTTQRLQRSTPTGTEEALDKRKSKGNIEENLRILIQSQPTLVETIIKDNLDDPGKPIVNVQFTDNYDSLMSQLARRDETGQRINRGAHIYSLTEASNNGAPSARISSFLKTKSNHEWVGWMDSKISGEPSEIAITSTYVNHGKAVNTDNVIDIANLQNSGTNKVYSRFTILGFSKNIDPLAGKESSISAFATNNKTVGSIRVLKDPTGGIPTLQEIANKYGVTLAQLMQVNNITNPNQDIEGLNLVVPADFSTVGTLTLPETATPTQIAKRYGISVAWLLELNGLTDPEQLLSSGTSVYLPGLRPLGSPALPAAKPFSANLEFSDYGAYTSYSVTYHVEGTLTPIFTNQFFNNIRGGR